MNENTNTNTAANNTDNTAADIVVRGFKNTERTIPFVLSGAFAKHGNVPGSTGSRFIKPGWYTTQTGVEHCLFGDLATEWREVFRDKDANLLIAEVSIPSGDAVSAAVALANLPPDQECWVVQLGAHPTLATVGSAEPTAVVTAIVELDGGKDPDLNGMGLDGEPVLATWHPGKSLPPSSPHDCEVGDHMTVSEAFSKGWRTAVLGWVFDKEGDK